MPPLLLVAGLLSLWTIGGVIGVRCANNLIGWLDSGRLYGFTHFQMRE